MKVEIKQVQDSTMFLDFITLVKENNYHPNVFDCGWTGYIDWLITHVYKNPGQFIIYVMYITDKPIGYMLLQGPSFLYNEICLFDMYITPDEQCKKLILLFVDKAFDVCKRVEVKRLTWRSYTLPEHYWMHLGDIMGVNIQRTNEYKINFDDTFSNTQSKKVVERINENLQ